MLFLLLACSDYGLKGMEDTLGGDDTAEPLAACDDADLSWAWTGSEPLHAPDAMPTTGFTSIELPDVDGAPAGSDRAYRAEVWFDELPEGLMADLQSDDGIWLWVNGVEVGHWGGDWQQEGCVNENAQCVERVDVPPIELTPFLIEGDNLIEARVSNAVMGHYFELIPHCAELP
jgi:hypothetical protein